MAASPIPQLSRGTQFSSSSSSTTMASTVLQWLSLVIISCLQATSGTNANFPAYSTQLKTILSISQEQLNYLSFTSDAGKLFGWVSGMAAIHLPLWVVLIVGSILGSIGFGVQYLLLMHSSLSYWHAILLTLVAGNSICWINTVCNVIVIRNFPSHHQVAVGLTTSYQGLSAKIYSATVDVLSPHRKARIFLLLNTLLPLIVSLIAIPFTREIKVARPRILDVGFLIMFVITICTGIYDMLTSLQSLSRILPPWGNLIVIIVLLLLALVVPILEMINELMRLWQTNGEALSIQHHNLEENNGANEMRRSKNEREEGEEEEEEDSRRKVDEIVVRDEIGATLMIRRIDFWLYFFVYLCGPTLGLVFQNNLGQIAESRGSSTSSLVSWSSSFVFFGRLIPALLDYFYRDRARIPRTASMAAFMAPIAVAFFLLLTKNEVVLYTSTAIIGVCTGAITCISVSLTTELFGTKNFSVNHNVVVGNIPIGSLLFGLLAAHLYHKEADGDGKCMGMECYRTTFIIWGSLCFFGTFLACILYYRTRNFYSQRQQMVS